ncbi:MAG TPA: transposase [Candidatus Coprocola pullicola]|nr:transposase [Candidatus Coprocola pullicola]
MRTGCEWTKYIKAKVYPEHIHILVEILPKISVWNFIGYLKGKSSRMLYEQNINIERCKGYCVHMAGDE